MQKMLTILVGATGLNAFEHLLVGSSSEYILRHAKSICWSWEKVKNIGKCSKERA